MSPDTKAGPAGRIFLSQPSQEEEAYLGRLFVITEIQTKRQDNQDLVEFLTNQINQIYYSEDRLTILAKTSVLTLEAVFESALNDLNAGLLEFFEARKQGFSYESASVTIGVLHQNRLLFSNLGANKALLIYKPKVNDGITTGGYNLINITKKTSDPTQDIYSQDKLFSNVVKGSIPSGAAFVFTNEALFEYLSESQLIKIISTLPPAGAAKQIRNTLEQTAVFVSFLALIVKNVNPLDETQKPRDKDLRIKIHNNLDGEAIHQTPKNRQEQPVRFDRDVNKESIKALNLTESRTAEILKPTGLINFRFFKDLPGKISLSGIFGSKKTIFIKRDQVVKKRAGALLSIVIKGLGQGAIILGALVKGGYELSVNAEKRQSAMQRLVVAKNSFRLKHWIALGLTVACVLLLVVGLVLGGISRKNAREQTSWNEINARLNQKFDEISGASIYNQALAKNYLLEAKTILDTLPENNNKQIQDKKAQTERYQNALNAIYKISAVDLKPLEGFNQAATYISFNQGKVYIVSGKTLSLYDPATKQTQSIVELGADNCRPVPIDESDGKFYCLSNQGLMVVNLAAKTVALTTIEQAPDSPAAAAIYNNRLYVSGSDKKIYRYTLSGSVWSGKKSWVDAGFLSGINDFSVDGAIYVLGGNQGAKFYSGVKQEAFNLESPAPALIAPKLLKTGKGYDSLILLDADGRVISFSKDGKLDSQYQSSVFKDAADLTVSQDGSVAYILSGSSLYELKLK